MKYCIAFLVFLSLAFGITAQSAPPFCLSNEKLVFGFQAVNKKILSICLAKDESYLVYRYGKPDNVELEFPTKFEDSWSQFVYSFYMRGGGPKNAGMDLNYLRFINNEYQYTIFDEYYSEDDSQKSGIWIENLKTHSVLELQSTPQTVLGSLVRLRDNEKIRKSDEL
jgi:hypothetical protein